MPAEQLVRWQTRRRERGQPIGAVAQGAAGRTRRRAWPMGTTPNDLPAAAGATGEHAPVASPMRRVGVRAEVVSPQTRERAAAHVRVARARREVERTAQRFMIYGDLEAARVRVRSCRRRRQAAWPGGQCEDGCATLMLRAAVRGTAVVHICRS